MKRADLVGQRFNRLIVMKYVGRKRTSALWKCLCDCGNETLNTTTDLRSNRSKSCGCFQKQRASEANKTHGLSKTPEYRIWTRIKSRCYNENTIDYPYYGGRGIKMSKGWKESFTEFLKDMGKRPAKTFTIERKDNEIGYTPHNCLWAERRTQTRNRSNTKTLTYKGQTKPMAEWAEILGLKYTTIQSRVARGWRIDDIIETPKTHRYLHHK